MRHFDLTPLYRSTVGFDRFNRVFDAIGRVDTPAQTYPPYNIEKSGEDAYRITMAVAGFREADIDVTVTDSTLVITGKQTVDQDGVEYLHRGIAGRPFERRFELADGIKVVGGRLENGLLHVDLVREVPAHKRPRQIKIEAAAA